MSDVHIDFPEGQDLASALTGELMNELVTGYLTDLHNAGKAPDTINNYRQRVNAFLRWRAERPLTGRLLIDYSIYLQTQHEGREGGGCRPRTIRGHLAALASFWKYAATQGYRDLPPITSVPRPRLDPERNVMPTEQQAQAILTAAERVGRTATLPIYQDYLRSRAVMIVSLGLYCGLRRSEMKALNLEDAIQDARGRHLRVRRSKGGEGRTIPIPTPAWTKIQDWLVIRAARVAAYGGKCDALLIDPQGRRMGDRSLDHALKTVLLLAGLEHSGITPHSLRHGCATLLIRAGVDVPTIQKILGHSNMETTLKYLHTDYGTMQAGSDALGRRLSGEAVEPASAPSPSLRRTAGERRPGGLRRTSR